MTMTTDFPSADDATRCDGSRLNEGLGPLVEAEMAAYYEGEYMDHSTARDRLMDFARAVIAAQPLYDKGAIDAAVAAERERWAHLWALDDGPNGQCTAEQLGKPQQ